MNKKFYRFNFGTFTGFWITVHNIDFNVTKIHYSIGLYIALISDFFELSVIYDSHFSIADHVTILRAYRKE